MHTVLCFNGSDTLGNVGIQADIRTVRDLGAHALSVITSVSVQAAPSDCVETHHCVLSPDLVAGQLAMLPAQEGVDAVKVGLVNDSASIRAIHHVLKDCPNVVCSPGILSQQGGRLMSDEAVCAYRQLLFPLCRILIIKCADAEILLHRPITTDADMLSAASDLHALGPEWVLLRGGTYTEGRINALLSGPAEGDSVNSSFFSSINIEGWQRHGVGGTLSTAIATRLSLGDDVEQAVSNAHSYLHSQVVYASSKPLFALQPHRIYDRFVSLLSDNYTRSHDVQYYASSLSISSRYLSQITAKICGRSPKQIIDDYLIQESLLLLTTTSLTIQQISNQLGFSSQNIFAKFFRAKRGCSPSAYRLRESNFRRE